MIGRTTDTGRMVVTHKGVVEPPAGRPNRNSAPLYERPYLETAPPRAILPEWVPAPNTILGTLKTMMGAHLASRRWIWEQYDHMVMGDTIGRPGGDAAVVRVHGTKKGLALTCDVTPRYVAADPVMGAKQAVAESWRNLIAVGADPLAITDNMNFGNPERPEVMGQFVGAIKGMKEACEGSNIRSCRATSRSTTRPTASPFRPPRQSAASASIPDIGKIAEHRPEGGGRPAGRRSAAKRATSANRSISCSSRARSKARRRPSISPTRSRPATSCAP